MPKTVEITVPSKDSKALARQLQDALDSIISLRLEEKVSLKPKGDVLTIEVTDKGLPELMRILSGKGIGTDSNSSISTSQPLSIITKDDNLNVLTDSNESTWEETEQTLARESNATWNMLAVMFAGGAIAALGIGTNALHLVIGAMVIAPAFEPILRPALAMVAKSGMGKKSFVIFLKVYAALLLGAIAAALFVNWYGGISPFGSEASYIGSFNLTEYWSKITLVSVIVSALASIAGVLLVLSNRSVLTAGVMIALALIPAVALFGVGLVNLDISLMMSSGLRWLVDVLLVFASGLGIFYYKKHRLHRRTMLPENR